MASAFPRSPKLTKGALIQLTEGLIGPVPNVVAFQYNPESVTRKLEPWAPPESSEEPEGEAQSDPQIQPYDPQETLDLTLLFDATDDWEEPDEHPIAAVSGVAHRLAALERMLYPVEEDGGLLGDVVSLISGDASGAVPRSIVPVVLLSFSPGLVMPIRITGYSVEEQAWSPTLYPIRASVSLGVKVLTDRAFPEEGEGAQTGIAAEIARSAYRYTRVQRDLLAAAHMGSGLGNVLSLLPF
ncbi:MAG: hypothetical protein GY937_25525 [bacterium]|nr:hypothetical protein [bacterium]